MRKPLFMAERLKETQIIRLGGKQLLVVWLAFAIMALSSFLFTRNIVAKQLEREALNTLYNLEAKIASDLLEMETTLQNVSQSVRSMILRGYSADAVLEYMLDISDYISSDEVRASGFHGVYGFFHVFGGIYMDGSGWVPPETFFPQERPWYVAAVNARGSAASTSPYIDAHTGKSIISYSRQIFDARGRSLGVISIDASIDKIADYVVGARFSGSGYGILMNEQLEFIAHHNDEYLGRGLRDVTSEISTFAGELERGTMVYEREITDYNGKRTVVFAYRLDNGWYLGVLVPIEEYYKEVKNKRNFIVGLGAVLAMLLSVILHRMAASKQKSDEKSRQKSRFLATISHEIRTPLNAILGITEIQLQNSELPDETKEAFDKIYASGYSLLSIINDVLDFSKIEAGKMVLNESEFLVTCLLNDVIQLNMLHLESKSVEFVLDVNENIPEVLVADELRIKQIINNLLSNAFKYTSEGRVELSLSFMEDADVPEIIMLEITVRDSGQGMSAEQISQLYKEYSRFNANANRQIAGTGLGLNITKRLVELMEGDIRIESEVGKGTTFTVILPQKKFECDPLGSEAAESLRNFTYMSAVQNEKLRISRTIMPYGSVLVVDDVDTNLYVAQSFLSPYQLQVEAVKSGYEALEKVSGGKVYDIIFMDHMMPGMDGIETTKKIRALGYTGAIIAFTANALVGNDKMFRDNGFDEFIPKPIDIRWMNTVLNRFIRDKYPEEAAKYANEILSDEIEDETDLTIEDIDLKLGLLRTGGMKNYLQTLKIFHQEGCRKIDEIRHELEAGNFMLYAIIMHSLKSAAANVGARKLSEHAKRMETLVRRNELDLLNTANDEFLAEFQEILDRISEVISRNKKKTVQIQSVVLDEKLLQLRRALDELDSVAIDEACEVLQNFPQTQELLTDVLAGKYEDAAEKIEILLTKNDK